jgi:transcription-repair coupling factor (superfamily II helicase)
MPSQPLDSPAVLSLALPTPQTPLLAWGELAGSARALALAETARVHPQPLLVITSDARESERLEQELKFFCDEAIPVLVFADTETLPYDPFSPAQELISKRLKTLSMLPHLQRGVVIVAIDSLLMRLPPVDYLKQRALSLNVKRQLDPQTFRHSLTDSGYVVVPQVSAPGEVAVRGSIVDCWPMGTERPVRIDFFDDQVETLRYFDPESQRSQETLTSLELLPGREYPTDPDAIKAFRQRYREAFEGDVNRSTIYTQISKGLSVGGIEYYLALWFDQLSSLFDYLPRAVLTIQLVEHIDTQLERIWRDIAARYEQRRHDIERPILAPEKVFLTPTDCLQRLRLEHGIRLNAMKIDPQLTTTATVVNVGIKPAPLLKRDLREGKDHDSYRPLKNFLDSLPDLKILLLTDSAGRRETLIESLAREDLKPQVAADWASFLRTPARLQIAVALETQAFYAPDKRLAVITEETLTGERAKQSRRRRRSERDPQQILLELKDLSMDAPVVHEEHGVGRYQGLTTLEIDGHPHEFLIIRYAGDDKLYVPITALTRVSRYTGAQPEQAPLHKLGGTEWTKARKKAAQRIRDVAAELLDLYAKRAARQGQPLSIQAHELAAFSAAFPFEETADQLDAIEAVMSDLADAKPMDRVVCGDVGFGKTEVAMRAAFVAAQAGKQVAVLVPTTLLAQQHQQNFSDRFADWPVRIESLSRFRSNKEVTQVLSGLKDGVIDIVIATHRLLSQGVQFKRLGLVIVDEEHRFGVRDKERLKALRTDVDMLTLTATPIPRTLNMALGGLRDLSLITTAPQARLAVKTFVLEWHAPTIREAILRELKRGGQIYFVHNAVESIERRAQELQQLVPEADIRVGHGQMRERDLEQLMFDFYHRRFNVLVSTTIIESGIDVPTANTILIDRADRFGLAQLHQMRGRVGRSHHRAYAYLLTPPKSLLTPDAEKRLEAIESLEELGAGFTLATHDLEIRGAGELLGDQQSGQMTEIGFNLFTELLDKAVKALKAGQEPDLEGPLHKGADVNLSLPALIPEPYLPDVHLRLMLYKRLAQTQSREERADFSSELIDRFGPLPEEVKNLVTITELKVRADRLGIARLDIGATGGVIEFAEQHQIEPARVIKLLQSQPGRYRLEGPHKLRLTHQAESPLTRIKMAEEYLRYFEQAQPATPAA